MSTSTSQPLPTSIPSLTAWTQTHLARLYASDSHNHNHKDSEALVESEPSFHSTFTSTFSNWAEVYTNHLPVTLSALEERIAGKRGATVEWRDVIEVPASGDDQDGERAHQAGIVAGFAIVTRSLKFRIRAAPAQMHTYIVFNAKIEQDPTAEPDEHGDRRRIVHLFETSLDRAATIHLQQQQQTTSCRVLISRLDCTSDSRGDSRVDRVNKLEDTSNQRIPRQPHAAHAHHAPPTPHNLSTTQETGNCGECETGRMTTCRGPISISITLAHADIL